MGKIGACNTVGSCNMRAITCPKSILRALSHAGSPQNYGPLLAKDSTTAPIIWGYQNKALI